MELGKTLLIIIKKMTNKIEGLFSILAAFLVLFSAMLDPRISMIVSITTLIGLGIYNFTKKEIK